MVYRRATQGRTNFVGWRISRRGSGFCWQMVLLFAIGAAVYYFMN